MKESKQQKNIISTLNENALHLPMRRHSLPPLLPVVVINRQPKAVNLRVMDHLPLEAET